jgi:hypothetical protein
MVASIGGFDGLGDPADRLDGAGVAGALDRTEDGLGVVAGVFQPAAYQWAGGFCRDAERGEDLGALGPKLVPGVGVGGGYGDRTVTILFWSARRAVRLGSASCRPLTFFSFFMTVSVVTGRL